MDKDGLLLFSESNREAARLRALQRYGIINTRPEAALDDLTKLAAHICDMPLSYISFINAHNQWFKSIVGMGLTSALRSNSFCQYTLEGNTVYEVPDTLEHPLFVGKPFVKASPFVRFYAGVPLTTDDGYNLGTLCVLDLQPRKLTEIQVGALQTLAKQVMMHLELRLQSKKLQADNSKLEQYRTFASNTTEVMIVIDAHSFAVEEANEAATTILGYAEYEIRRQHLVHFCYPDDLPKVIAMIEKGIQENEKIQEFEIRVVCKDQTIKWLSWNAFSKAGKWFAFGRDITQRKKVERAFNKSQKALLESQAIAHVGSWEFDMENRQLSWSDETFRLHGLQPRPNAPTMEEIKSMVPTDDMALISAKLHATVGFGVAYECEYRCILPDEATKYLYSQGQLKVEEGKPVKIIGTILDVTERKLNEIALLSAKEQAEKSMKAKEQFLSTMSHEIRTPMNAVIGITHLLLQEDPNPNQLEYLQILKFSGENLIVLINDILDFNKIEAGKVTLEEVDFSMSELIGSIKQSFVHKANEKGIKLKVRLDTDLPETLIGDPVRLNQILNNLIGNAIKFTSKGSVQIELSLDKEDNDQVELTFSVKDTGIGIPVNKQAAIFESFTQASSDTTRKFGGTGLGLAITKRLLELQGSQICLESREGDGAKFWFTITFKKSNRPITTVRYFPHLAEPQEILTDVKLLMVEDNDVNQMVTGKFLTKWGIEIDYASNGLLAIEKIRNSYYDIILMDLQMPEMDGYEATTIIRSMEGQYPKAVPIIALTASAMIDVKDRVVAAGMNDYIAKPFHPNELYNKVAKYTKRAPIPLV